MTTHRLRSPLRTTLAAVSLLGPAALYVSNDSFRDTTHHAYLTSKRVFVVAKATLRCFSLYRTTLNTQYATASQRQDALNFSHQRAAEITLDALEKNGGIYIKLGQHISAMTYLLPPEWTDTMIPLQSKCPRSSIEEIGEMFKSDTRLELDEYFSYLDETPVGVASLAQVHRGTLKSTGESVAVKFQHPSLREFVPLDVVMTRTVFNLLNKFFPEYPLTWLGEELESSIFVELDFTKEAENAINTSNYFKGTEGKTALRVPRIVNARPRILVMEYLGGARLDDLAYMDKHKISRSQVSSCLSHIFNSMIFTPGVGVHCDPHGGNLAIRAVENGAHNFEIVLYDHGLYRNLSSNMRAGYARFWLALLDGNLVEMKCAAKDFAHITDRQFPILAAAITGRDFQHALGGNVSSSRDNQEIQMMSNALLEDGLMLDLMHLLATLPRVVLLILKTNDLTRRLDEDLQNPLGPERTFLILATYCARTVYTDQKRKINEHCQGLKWVWMTAKANLQYQRIVSKLWVYDTFMWLKFVGRDCRDLVVRWVLPSRSSQCEQHGYIAERVQPLLHQA